MFFQIKNVQVNYFPQHWRPKFLWKTACWSIFVVQTQAVFSEQQTIKPEILTGTVLTELQLGENGPWDFQIDKEGQLWLAYYDRDHLLQLRDPTGKNRLLVPEGQTHATSGLSLAARGVGVSLLWREKLSTKSLYLVDTLIPEMKPLEISGGSEPLVRIHAVAGGPDLLHILWYGERPEGSPSEPHHLYYRAWTPSTQTLSPLEIVAPGIYPVLTAGAAGDLMVYSREINESADNQEANAHRITARYRPAPNSSDGAHGFGAPVTVATVPDITPIFEAFRSGSRWFVMWVAQYGLLHDEYLLEGGYSDDQGQTWHKMQFENLRGLDITNLRVINNEQGQILLALTGRFRNSGQKENKVDVWLLRSQDRGETWAKIEQPRLASPLNQSNQDKNQNPLANFQARDPALTFGSEPGQVLLLWEDWRQIRPSVYANFSRDGGQTWAISNLRLPTPVGKNITLSDTENALYTQGDHFQLIAEQFNDDRFSAKQLIQFNFTPADLQTWANAAAQEQGSNAGKVKADLLRTRASEYWEALVAQNYAKTYEYQDPFFRNKFSAEAYRARMGKVRYIQAAVQDVKINGSIAEVITHIRADVPSFRVPSTGEVVQQPEREVDVNSTWIWIDNNWFCEFRMRTEDKTFTRY